LKSRSHCIQRPSTRAPILGRGLLLRIPPHGQARGAPQAVIYRSALLTRTVPSSSKRRCSISSVATS
jgi:hypothetical protein